MLGPVLGLGETQGQRGCRQRRVVGEINEGEGQLLASTTPVRTVSVVNAQRDRRAGSSRRGPTTRIAL